ncbi:phosphoribosylamine--glycine ligase [Pacificimonas flava]|uniref:Phosphoribosylamine--glycine ligase n=2 Tax=Pacificimonas TaxID=1960290 RepID=A0A219B687_9SPHN|nr:MULTISPECIES: phosphoribosylamine--glycine ligase [Pacificimonas]MBZ6379504.1 phosphoribosylamine--glycine ligase [Pacificimonas aurantium]OWV33308.1 phosphoribosylamine--glycine ligase [Pacificimonas flava]
MNLLLIGGGGREHALAWKLAQSPLLTKLFAAPGNPGIAEHAECTDLDISDHRAVIEFCGRHDVELVVVGPEQPLVDGLADSLKRAGIRCFGPSAAAARLEGSKGFTKDLCAKYDIPTAAYGRFTDAAAAKAFLDGRSPPFVIKADGLAAGKGVVIAEDRAAADAALDDMFGGAFGGSGAEVVIEEFLEGEEASLFALCDGKTVVPLAGAQDHKRVGDGDTGPNTGGMGAYSPAPILDDAMTARVMRDIVEPTARAMAAEGAPYVGVLYAGLMIGPDGPQLIEYNCRFGDPECQVLMKRMDSDLLPALVAVCDGTLADISVAWRSESALTVVMAAEGYPGTPKKGGEIRGLDTAEASGATIFHAGTKVADGKLVANGGRVLNVTATGPSLKVAADTAYKACAAIQWEDGFYRRDIGHRAL